jgi:hypothetical protein
MVAMVGVVAEVVMVAPEEEEAMGIMVKTDTDVVVVVEAVVLEEMAEMVEMVAMVVSFSNLF